MIENNENEVGFIYSRDLVDEINKIPKISGRANLVNALINAYDLFKNLKVVKPTIANEKWLKMYHSKDYIDFLKQFTKDADEERLLSGVADDFGIGFDCPVIVSMFEYCCTIAGASLTAAHLININKYKYVINWFGGWHHAKRDKASGFCYVNDIVLCILKLREKFSRILYIDLDLHHGDGVQDAFEHSDKVLCLSIHKFTPGFFPGTGSLEEIGKNAGKYYTINVPLVSGVNNKMFFEVFSKMVNNVFQAFNPQVIVCQCGADSLFGDPIDAQNPFNLTVDGYCDCIDILIKSNIPTIFLGGGGYNFANTSRLWCKITSKLLKLDLNNDIPEHDYFLDYGPKYELATNAGLIKNKNSTEYIDTVLRYHFDHMNYIKPKKNEDIENISQAE